MAPNIVFAPNITQNAEHRHWTQNTNTAHFRSLYKGLVKRQNVVWDHARLVFYKLFEPFSNRMNLRFVADEKPLNHVNKL